MKSDYSNNRKTGWSPRLYLLMTPLPKTTDQVIAELMSKPGIDIGKRVVGDLIIIETTLHVYKLEVRNPKFGIVRIHATDRSCREGVTGELVESTYDLAGKVRLPRWIGKSLRMQIRFANGILGCSPAVSCRLDARTWGYEVF